VVDTHTLTREDITYSQCFFVKEYFPVPSSGVNRCKNRHAPFGILANHKIQMCHNSMKKNNDTKDYSEQLEFLNSEPHYGSKKTVNQSSDFPVRRTGSYRHKKALTTAASGVNSRHIGPFIGFLATGAQCDILLNCAL